MVSARSWLRFSALALQTAAVSAMGNLATCPFRVALSCLLAMIVSSSLVMSSGRSSARIRGRRYAGPVGARRDTGHTPERAREVTGRAKSYDPRGRGDGQVAAGQQALGVLDAPPHDEPTRRQARALLEQSREMK